ncbi:RNA polymerase sigma factor (sigma-70 family) [Flavobacterium gossypii]|uniref:RNA polymerase sigma factor (Sigma-70 family) n=1 Tax=Flavobacterium gossypii TaxID=1646119 RepID=A0ABR6DU89_9FLAO|nr:MULTISPECIES: sigma-70 family RNA polymerase sigma factor [Flavobacterium]MBA9075238.1 RNA polymerase sigma factor (sigma-70 family) [Flavobacterium gossypii]WDO14692.1 sigma-70 family RNA polymerase sigma factor [Flavobacterium sp. WW92]
MKAETSLTMEEKPKNTISSTVSKFGKGLTSFVRGKVNSSEDAEDVLQEVWYQLSNFSNIDDIESMSGWLFQVAKNKITDLYRKKKPEALENYSYENDEGEFSFKEILLLDDSENPDLALFKELFWSELLKALDELPENQKQVFILNEIEDLTLQEIADQTNENIKTIISRKGYAVKYLRKKLNYLYQELNY